MFRSLKKAAASLERNFESAFSVPPASRTAFTGTTLTIAGIKLKLGPVFAEGGYSFIHEATPVSDSSKTTRYAIKRISCVDPDAKRKADHEIHFLRQLPPHPNVVKFYDAVFYQNHAFLLFELVDGGTLQERLQSSSLNSAHRLDMFADAVAAVVHLHTQQPPIASRDIKLENLLFDRLQHSYKLCDFGSVTTTAGRPSSRKQILAVEEDVSSNCTAMYRAPELVDLYSKQFICERVDVWALGCVWHAILFASLPFDGQSALQISKGLQHIPTQPTYPHEFIVLLKGMLTVDPAIRMDSFAVLEMVATLQGNKIAHHIRERALELRKTRSCDFGNPVNDSTFAITSSETASGDCMQPAASIVSLSPHVPESSAKAQNFLPKNHREEFENIPTNDMNDDEAGWADFDSAFSGTPSASRDTVASTLAAPSVLDKSEKRASAAYGQSASLSNAHQSAPLIDFSDLLISQNPLQSSGSHSDRSAFRATSEPGNTSPRSRSNADDLIDFG